MNTHPLLRFGIFIGLLALSAWLGARPAYRVFKGWRMERNLVAAQKAVNEVRMDEARDLSLTVLRSGDPCLEAFRVLEKSMGSLRDPRYPDVARALMAHPDGSDDDRFKGFEGLVPEAPLGIVGQAWAALPERCHNDPRFATVFARRLLADGHLGEAASVLLKVPTPNRSPQLTRELIAVLIRSGKRDGYDEAQRMICAEMPNDPGAMEEWLDLLESIPAMSLQASILEPLRAVIGKPAAKIDPARQALMLARFDYAADFNHRADVIERAVARWMKDAPVAVAQFLLGLGLNQRVLELFPVESATRQPALFPHLLAAARRVGAWDTIMALLNAGAPAGMPKYEELAYRACAAAKLGDSPEHVKLWDSAMGDARTSGRSAAFLKLAQVAREMDAPGDAELALIEAVRTRNGPLPLYADLAPLLTSLVQKGRENILLEICSIYSGYEPGNPVLLTQYAYLGCLMGRVEAGPVLKAMEPLLKAFPKELPVQCAMATLYLCDKQPARAMEIMNKLAVDPEKLAPSYRIVHVASQALNGKIPHDDPKINDFPWKSLLPCERKKFGSMLREQREEERF